MSEVTCTNPSEMSPPLGLYSQVVRHERSGLAFIAGQVATDMHGVVVGSGDVMEQTRQTFRNIEGALNSLGCDWSSVIRFTTYITDRAYSTGFSQARKELFESAYPNGNYPAHTLMIVAGLSAESHLVEIDTVVGLGGKS
jgi:2-iminobutanoate/2-iminopropanoate deaminase